MPRPSCKRSGQSFISRRKPFPPRGYPYGTMTRRDIAAHREARGTANLAKSDASRRSLILGGSWKTFGRCSWPHRTKARSHKRGLGQLSRVRFNWKNLTRQNGLDFLRRVPEIGIVTKTTRYPPHQARRPVDVGRGTYRHDSTCWCIWRRIGLSRSAPMHAEAAAGIGERRRVPPGIIGVR